MTMPGRRQLAVEMQLDPSVLGSSYTARADLRPDEAGTRRPLLELKLYVARSWGAVATSMCSPTVIPSMSPGASARPAAVKADRSHALSSLELSMPRDAFSAVSLIASTRRRPTKFVEGSQ